MVEGGTFKNKIRNIGMKVYEECEKEPWNCRPLLLRSMRQFPRNTHEAVFTYKCLLIATRPPLHSGFGASAARALPGSWQKCRIARLPLDPLN